MTDNSSLGRKVAVSIVGATAALALWQTSGLGAGVPALHVNAATAAPAPKTPPPPTQAPVGPAPDEFIGDAALRDQLDLSRARLVGDRYYVQLDSGDTAVLTLEPSVQAAAEATLARAKAPYGAIVVTATDGRILCLLYTSPSPRDQRGSRMPSSA